MVSVILDSNFLLIPFQFRVDIFEELNNIFGKTDFIVLSTNLDELKALTDKSAKIAKEASAALDLIPKCKILSVCRKGKETNDDIIVRKAKEWSSIVATNDSELRKKVREVGLPVVFLRQKSYLGIEGYVQNNP